MIKSKRILTLEKRVAALEDTVKLLFCEKEAKQGQQGTELSYEEVISEWLNGKATNQRT